MDYFIVEQSPRVESDYVFLESDPEGLGLEGWRISKGEKLGNLSKLEVKWYMDKKNPGIKLPSLIGNTRNRIVVDQPMKGVIEATGMPMECVPFTLYNHKRRVASRDYFIINVLGTFDCLNYDESEIEYDDEYPDEVIDIDLHVLDSRKLRDAPDIFRIKEEPPLIVISHRLADKLRKINPTNVYLHKVEKAP